MRFGDSTCEAIVRKGERSGIAAPVNRPHGPDESHREDFCRQR